MKKSDFNQSVSAAIFLNDHIRRDGRKMAKHRGEVLDKVIRARHSNLTKLAESLPWTVKTMYRHFQDANLPIDKLMIYSKVLNYDFSEDLPELGVFKWRLSEPESACNAKPSPGVSGEDFYRKKYEDLLLRYNDMLESFNKVLSKLAEQ